MLAREYLWRLALGREGAAATAAPGRRPRSRYALAIPLLLTLEAAAAVERHVRTRRRSEPPRLGPPSAEAEEVIRWRQRRRAVARVGRRFRRGRRAAAALGGGLAGLVIGWRLAGLVALRGRVDGASGLGALVLVALGVVGPWLLVDLLRRWTERRYYWEWQ